MRELSISNRGLGTTPQQTGPSQDPCQEYSKAVNNRADISRNMDSLGLAWPASVVFSNCVDLLNSQGIS